MTRCIVARYTDTTTPEAASNIGIAIPLKHTTSKKKYDLLGGTPSKPLLDHLLSIVPESSSWSST